MIKSMTGFGKAVCETKTKRITIEIKSLNSKQLDVSLRLPGQYREKEVEIRNEISKLLERGKIDFSMHLEIIGFESNTAINEALVKAYYLQLTKIEKDLGIESKQDLLASILRLPDVLKTDREEINEEEWNLVFNESCKALRDLDGFRRQEGLAMEGDITMRIELIDKYLTNIDKFEKSRIQTVKKRIETNLGELLQDDKFDRNRFEQELIYYLEKFDITEEKVRLTNHCRYFIETMKSEEPVGRKLAFISQEIGREINTIGSKANDSDIQKLVVQMKNELEKIKEQLLNIL